MIFLKPVRGFVYSWFHKPYRQVLSIVQGPLLGPNSKVQVVKIKTQEGLFLEFYNLAKGALHSKLAQISLSNPYDGYIQFKGNPTNLFILDLDRDGILEVIAPSFDRNLVSHLHVFHYSKEKQGFTAVDLEDFEFP